MSKLALLGAALVLSLMGSASAQQPPSSNTNKPAPTSPGSPNGHPGTSSSSANTPLNGESTGTRTPQIDKQADTHDNQAAAPSTPARK